MRCYRDATAIVTGGASGIGRALGETLADQGAHVYLADLDGERARDVARRIGERGGSASGVHVDVTDPEAVQGAVDRAVAERGRLDYMFNNAGIVMVAEALEMTLGDWNRSLDVNLRGVIHGVHAAYPVMVRQGSGHIVNIASVAGLVPTPGVAAYSMTKHAVVGLSTSLRYEAEPRGVRVTVVCPGMVESSIFHAADIRGFDREALMRNARIASYPAAACARDVLRGVAKDARVLVVTRHGRALTRLYRHAPELFDRLARLGTRRGFAGKRD